jgi:hypothetical protein
MITFLIYLLVVVIVMALGWWIITQLPLPEPIGRIVRVVFVVVCALIIILMLLGLVGYAPAPFPLR